MPRSFLRLRRFALALVEIGVIGKLQRLVDDRREIAAVISIADRGLERHRRRRNEVLLAQPHGSMPVTRAASSTTRSSA